MTRAECSRQVSRRWVLASVFVCASLLCSTLLSATLVRAQMEPPADPEGVAALFSHHAPIDGAQALARLPLSAEVLQELSADLSDLRITGADGAVIPFSIYRPPTVLLNPASRRVLANTLEERRTIRRGRSPEVEELYHLAGSGLPLGAEGWSLNFETSQGRFVKQVVLWWASETGRVELGTSSIYRLQGPLRERLSIALPPLPERGSASAESGHLEIQISGEGSYLEPEFVLAQTTGPIRVPQASIGLRTLGIENGDAFTRILVARPPAVVPQNLIFSTDTTDFHRRVELFDLAQGQAPRPVGTGTIYRAQDLGDVLNLSVAVSALRGETLEIRLYGGENSVLESVRVSATVSAPQLLLAAAHGMTLHFGGGRVSAADYDMAHLMALAGSRLRTLPLLSLGEIYRSPPRGDRPALDFVMSPGRVVEPEVFSHQMSLEVLGHGDGLAQVDLPPGLLAEASEDLSDLRIIDGTERQWPYLLGQPQSIGRFEVALSAVDENSSTRGREQGASESESSYLLSLPARRLVPISMTLDPSLPFVDRPYRVVGDTEAGPVVLAEGRLRRGRGDQSPLTIVLSSVRVSSMTLVIEDNEQSPMRLFSTELELRGQRAFLVAPEGMYTALVGADGLDAPVYGLAGVSDIILAVHAVPAVVGEVDANGRFLAPTVAPWYEGVDPKMWILWALLIAAVVGLGLLTFKLIGQAGPPEPVDEAPEGGAPEGGAPEVGARGKSPIDASSTEKGGADTRPETDDEAPDSTSE